MQGLTKSFLERCLELADPIVALQSLSILANLSSTAVKDLLAEVIGLPSCLSVAPIVLVISCWDTYPFAL